MLWHRKALLRLRSLFGRDRVEDELDGELRFHLEHLIEQNIAAGMKPTEARVAAVRAIGNLELWKEECRDTRRVEWIHELVRDTRYAARMLAAHPAFASVAVLSLALGIGVNTAIFSVADAVLLKNLPVRDPQQLVTIDVVNARGEQSNSSYPLFEEVRRMQAFANSFAAQDGMERHDTVWDDGRRFAETRLQLVSESYFDVLGVHPAIGRVFPPAGEVAVVSHDFWKRISGDPSILGRTFTVQGNRVTVIGVAPAGFFGESAGRAPEIWVPMSMQPALHRGANLLTSANTGWLRIIARMPAGMNVAGATTAAAAFRSERPTRDATKFVVAPAAKGLDYLRRTYSIPLRALMAAVGLILLLACANVANLLLARTTERKREISIRLAIGAGRWRIVRQLMTENALIAVLGGALGVLLAGWGTQALLVLASNGREPLALAAGLDWRVLAFTSAACVLSCLLFGLAPAMDAARRGAALTVTTTARPARSWGRALVVLQIAVSVLLVAGAGLFVRTLQNLRGQDLGFRSESLLQVSVQARQSGYPQTDIPAVHRRVAEKVRGVPGVLAVSTAGSGFGTGTSRTCCIAIEGYTFTEGENREVRTNGVAPDYFQTVQLPIALGRTFTAQEVGSQQVALINRTMARRFYGSASPVGKRFGWGDPPKLKYGIEIVGVVEDASIGNLREEARPLIYFPAENSRIVFARVAGSGAVASIGKAIREVDPNLLHSIQPITEVIERGLTSERMMATLGAFFGALALLLAGVGLYGLTNYAVARRTREIGIRMALGATRTQIVTSICREVALLTATGLAIGIPASVAAGKLVSKLLFGVRPDDLTVLFAVVLTLASVAALSAIRPTRRAAATDPATTLRQE